MKYVLALLVLVGLGCNNDEPASSGSKPRILKDSNIVTQPRNPYAEVDVSPMDMSYLPSDYSKRTNYTTPPVARVIYSRPHKQGRVIFGSLIKYGEPWRLGANEATEIEFFQTVTIQDTKVNKGKYVMYYIPQKENWTIVFNSNLNSWGLNIDSTKDVHRFNIPVQHKNQSVEYFSMVFQEKDKGADLVIAWDDVEARLPIQY